MEDAQEITSAELFSCDSEISSTAVLKRQFKMAEIEFNSNSLKAKSLSFLTDANLSRLRHLLLEHYPELDNKHLLIYPSRFPIFEMEHFPLHLLIYWQPRKDCNLLVKYRAHLAYSKQNDVFLPPTDRLSVDFEMDEAAPGYDIVETLIEFGLAKVGRPGARPDCSQKHATFFTEEAPIVPIGHAQNSIDLAFTRPRALLQSLHPLCSKDIKNYFWYEYETLLSLAKEFYGSLTEPEEKLLMLGDSKPVVGKVLNIKKSDFPKFPEAPEVPRFGLLEPLIHQSNASALEAEGFRLEFQVSSTAPHHYRVVIFENCGYNGSDFFEVTDQDWLNLKRLAADKHTWSPPAFTGSWLRGGKWQLEWWCPPNHTVMSSIMPPVGPFWDLYIAILELAGFEYFFLNTGESSKESPQGRSSNVNSVEEGEPHRD